MASEIFSETKAGIEFSVHLIPGARKEQILGIIETERGIVIKISIHEKPTENNANEALIKFLAGRLNVAKTNVEIKRGHKSRDKRIFVSGITLAQIPSDLLDQVKI